MYEGGGKKKGKRTNVMKSIHIFNTVAQIWTAVHAFTTTLKST